MFEKSILKLVDILIEPLAKEVRFAIKNRLLEYQINEFKRNSKVKTVLHRHSPVDLLDIYQPLYLRTKIEAKPEFRLGGPKEERLEISKVSDLFTKFNGAAIIGSAGSGKSTLLKYIFISSVSQEYKIPIFIELRNLSNSDLSMIAYIYERVLASDTVSRTDKSLEKMLTKGQFLIIFDGHDEIKFEKNEIITNSINEFVAKYPENNFIVSSRNSSQIGMLPSFKNYFIDQLRKDEVISLVKKQLNIFQIDDYTEVITSLEKVYNSELKPFLSNPLLLSMYVLCFQFDSNIPSKKSTYYKHVFDSLYSSHDTLSKFGYIREKRSNLNKEQFLSMLSMFGIISYFEGIYEFDEQYIFEKIGQIKQVKKYMKFDNSKLLFDLTTNICILLKDGKLYSFHHRSIQEYFAALYIKDIKIDTKQKLYSRISSNYWSSWEGREHYNLMTFLAEIDEYSFVKGIILPTLNRLQKIEAGRNLWGWLLVNDFSKLCELLSLLDTYRVQFDKVRISNSDVIGFESNNSDISVLEMSSIDVYAKLVKEGLVNIQSPSTNSVDEYLNRQRDYIRQIKLGCV